MSKNSSIFNVVILWAQPLNTGDAAILEAEVELLTDAFSDFSRIEYRVHALDAEASLRYYPDFLFTQALFKEPSTIRKSSELLRGAKRRLSRHRLYLARRILFSRLWRLAKWFFIGDEWKAAMEIVNADLVVSTGGTYLVPHYNFEAQLFSYEIAMQAGAPLAFFTQSLGPFAKKDIKQRIFKVFDYSIAILVRDEKSKLHLRELCVSQDKVSVLPDAAFALQDPTLQLTSSQKRLRWLRTASLKLSVSVREWSHFKTRNVDYGLQRYFETVAKLIEKICAEYHATVTFISTCQGRPEYQFDDSIIAERIVEFLPQSLRGQVQIDRHAYNPRELQLRLSQFDFAIATRMHMAILSLNSGVPVLGVAYEFKMAELFHELGCEDFLMDIENVDPESAVEQLKFLLSDLPGCYQRIVREVRRLQLASARSSELIRRAYDKTHGFD